MTCILCIHRYPLYPLSSLSLSLYLSIYLSLSLSLSLRGARTARRLGLGGDGCDPIREQGPSLSLSLSLSLSVRAPARPHRCDRASSPAAQPVECAHVPLIEPSDIQVPQQPLRCVRGKEGDRCNQQNKQITRVQFCCSVPLTPTP